MDETVGTPSPPRRSPLEARLAEVGQELSEALGRMIASLPDEPRGPQAVAHALGVDKVLASRVLKAVRAKDPLAVTHHAPGPEPLRRFVKAARRRGADSRLVTRAAAAVDQFAAVIRREAGDRSSLAAIMSAWLPEARRDFELSRKQSAYRAMSQLRGTMVETTLGVVMLSPSDDGEHIDVVWILGLLGLQRLRPGTRVKLVTRRMTGKGAPRAPMSLSGEPIHQVSDARLDEFCVGTPAELEVQRVGDVVHYVLAGDDFGPSSAADLMLVEVNRREMARYVPAELGRKGYVFAEVGAPSKHLLLDVFVHEDVYPDSDPALAIYDTALEGVADVNDPSRDADRLDLQESIVPLARGLGSARNARIPDYVEMLRHVMDRIGWDAGAFRGYRCEIDYPVYGSQIAMTFVPPPPPA